MERLGRRSAIAYLALLGLALAAGFASWPIFAVDTDLWHHLNAGRYIAGTHSLPASAFYSFLRPTPTTIDYYWVAQLLYYGVYSVAGYAGLVALRTLIALGTYALVLATLRLGKRDEHWGVTAFLFTCIALFLVGRLTMVRPCDLSYLWIAAFLFLLESRRRLLALPLLAVLWVNLHGIEFPVLLLICGAYLGEWMLARLGLLRHLTAPPGLAFAAAGAALLAVWVTPHPLALLATPFEPFAVASQYIAEMKPVDPTSLFAFRMDGLYVSRPSFLTLTLFAAAAAVVASFRGLRPRAAHLALLAGGAVLLLRAERFSAEFVLLAVPLLGSLAPRLTWPEALPRVLGGGLLVALAALPFWHLYNVFETRCAFPLCPADLPNGSAAFLARVGATGPVLNAPDMGGYLEWELWPRQPIYADLHTPFLFSDRDVFVGQQAFRDPTVFAALVAEYHPAFLVVPRALSEFPGWVRKVADYVPVFADDASVLYASADSQAELVASQRLTAIDPFALEVVGDPEKPETLARAAAELARVTEIHPAGFRMRVFEGTLALQRGDSDGALRIADQVIDRHRDRPEPQRLRGDALLAKGKAGEAALAYEAALARVETLAARGEEPDPSGRAPLLQSRLWMSYSRVGNHEAAYQALRSALGDLYRPSVGHEELASLGITALSAGRTAEGTTLLEFALDKTPATSVELRRKLEAKLKSLASVRQ